MVEGAAVSNRKEIRKLTSEHIELFIFFFLFLNIFKDSGLNKYTEYQDDIDRALDYLQKRGMT